MSNKMTKCKTCGAEIAKSAKICPKCGARQKKHTAPGVFLVIIGIILLVAAFGGSGENDKPQRVTTSNPPDEPASSVPTSIPTFAPEDEIFTVGDSVALSDIVVTLVDVSESRGGNYMTPSEGKVFVICEFLIENNSNKDIAVSSILSFEAYVDNYATNMNLSATLSSGKSQLDGSIASGKKMNGVVGYEADPDWSSLEVRFKPDFWTGNEFLFVYSR